MASGISAFGSATLVMQGPGGKVRFEITGDRTSVGRTRENEIVLQDPAVSSSHCEFVADRTGLLLRDLNSSNGTYVNGRRIQAGPVYDGDVLKIGQFQGRIAVRRIDGKPFTAPGRVGPTIAIALVSVLVVGALVAGFMLLKGRQDADRELFLRYETKAKELLTAEPCSALAEASKELKNIERGLDEPVLGRRGKTITAAEGKRNTALLEKSRAREGLVEKALQSAEEVVATHKAGVEELQAMALQFHASAVSSGIRQLEPLYAARVYRSEELAGQLKKYSEQMREYHGLIERLTRQADRDAYDQLNGYRFRVDPARLADECRKDFAQSQQDGLLKLAGITL